MLNLSKILMLIIFGLSFQFASSFSQQEQLGIFENQTDVGKVVHSGSVIYNPAEQTYTIHGSGTNMWLDQDEFHFLWKRLQGNFILRTEAKFIGKGVEPHRKLGWIVRSSLESNSPHVNAAVHGDGLTSLQFRKTLGEMTEEKKFSLTGADVIQLERKGDTYIMSVARFGDTLVTEQASDIALGDEVYAGLYVCSHNKDVIEKAIFRNVRIIIPAKDDFMPYRDYIGSNLEILDVESGKRKIIYRSLESLQAPNWTPDGKALIYNSNGQLYRFDLESNSPKIIDTDFAINNNNDHVLSFNGKMLGISHHSKADENKSIIYTVLIRGGKPKRITTLGPSYLHGWSPDGKFLVYTGERNGEFDIYKISAKGGIEFPVRVILP